MHGCIVCPARERAAYQNWFPHIAPCHKFHKRDDTGVRKIGAFSRWREYRYVLAAITNPNSRSERFFFLLRLPVIYETVNWLVNYKRWTTLL